MNNQTSAKVINIFGSTGENSNRHKILNVLLAANGESVRLKDISSVVGLDVRLVGAHLGYLKRCGQAKRIARGQWAAVQDTEEVRHTTFASHNSRKSTYPFTIWPVEKQLVSLLSKARRRGSACDVDAEYLLGMYDAQDGRCAISGLPMTTFHGLGYKRCPTNISIDQIDAGAGYIKGNVQLVCWIVNAMKQQMTNEQVIALAAAIFNNQRG